MEYIVDVYDDDYLKFEVDMNEMINKSGGCILLKDLLVFDLKIMCVLIYGMLRIGGLEEMLEIIFKFLGMSVIIVEIYGVCMEIFVK